MAGFVTVIQAVEKQSGFWAGRLLDENGAGVGSTILTSLTGTLYDRATQAIINRRNAQNIINANQCTMDAAGNFRWDWVPADQTYVNPNRTIEEHVMLITAKWTRSDGFPGEANHEIHFNVARVVLNA